MDGYVIKKGLILFCLNVGKNQTYILYIHSTNKVFQIGIYDYPIMKLPLITVVLCEACESFSKMSSKIFHEKIVTIRKITLEFQISNLYANFTMLKEEIDFILQNGICRKWGQVNCP